MDATTFNYVLAQFGITGVMVLAVVLAVFRLSADLAKLRTQLQQDIARDLLNKRFAAYSDLWSKMAPLALYSDDPMSRAKAQRLAQSLSDWYFSANGGMFLTARARDFYFALQETLEAAGDMKEFKVTQRPDDVKGLFRAFLAKAGGAHSVAAEGLEQPDAIDSARWLDTCKALAQALKALPANSEREVSDTVFAVVQQVSSALRTTLAQELHTRLDLRLPGP